MKLFRYILLFITITAFAQPAKITHKLSDEWAEVQFDSLGPLNKMAYADTANFMHEKVYPCARCLLRPEVAEALERANVLAAEKGYRLVMYDCYRPYPIQYKMYELVNNPLYVAKPGKGSNHNRGQAVDISLADENGELLDMGGAFDEFSEISHYAYKDIPRKARKNRKRLRTIMIEAGFTPFESEWWHFDYKQKTYETSNYVWECP
ncbi:M15 family metallopeptidase [Flavobacterium sp. RHBU_3]|uniref:M15 family metallopeptidase n=1 Tax=Flavobacterium sp. RHBU_3 TaxID=3391184 RepID=UPI00398568E7